MTVTNNIENRVRLAEFNPVSPTTVFPLDYPVYAADDLTALKNDFEVTLNGALTTGYTFTATFVDGVATDAALNFSPGITGNLQVASLRAPRSILDVPTGRGFTSGELQSGFNATLASARDTFDLALEQRASLLALAAIISSGGATMPPLLQSLTMGALSTLGAGILSVIVMAWDSTTPVGPESYVRVGSAPSHALKFRSLDRYLADGITIDNTNGGWWGVSPGPDGLDVRAGGVRFDSNIGGTTGVDNTAAFQRCIDSSFPLRLAAGFAAFDGHPVVQPQQAISGAVPGDTSNISTSGSVLVYRGAAARSGGSGDAAECFLSSAPGSAFAGATYWQNFSIVGTAANTATWLLRTYTTRNFHLTNIKFRNNASTLRWDSYGGDETGITQVWVGGLIGPSCHQMVKNARGDTSWQVFYSGCDFICGLDSSVANADQDKYLGYAWGIDADATDVYLSDKTHFNGCCTMGRNGGGFVSDRTTNWENVSFGGDSGRAAVVLRNKLGTAGQQGISIIAASINGQINVPSIGVILDASYNLASAPCNTTITASFRSCVQCDVKTIGNSTFLASGGSCINSSFYNLGDVAEPRISSPSTWRGVAVTWRGFTVGQGVRGLPAEWLINRGAPIVWTPRLDTAVGVGGIAGIDSRGCTPTVVGTLSINSGVVLTSFLTSFLPRATITSAGVDGTGSAEIYGPRFLAVGDAINKCGGFLHAIFGGSQLTALSRGFIGFIASAAATPAGVNPSTFVQCFGIGFDAGGTTFKVMRGGSSPAVPDDLGANFPCRILTAMYDLMIWWSPFGSSYNLRLERLDTKGDPVCKDYIGSTPNNSLAPHVWLNEGGTAAAAVKLDFGYLECKPFVNDIFAGNI